MKQKNKDIKDLEKSTKNYQNYNQRNYDNLNNLYANKLQEVVLNNSTLKSLLIEYDKKRINAENIAQKEKENLYEEFPELDEIDKKLSSLAFSSMIELTKNNDKKIIENLNSNIEALKKKKENILNSIGEKSKKIIPNYECKKCNENIWCRTNKFV